jgi:hypothetical protein
MRLPLAQNLSMQKVFWACLLAMFLVHSKAQVSILIEDQNQTNFQLIANGYLQNATSAKALLFSGYSANVAYDLVFLTGPNQTQQFSRKLNLPQAGIYHYVITQNFKGQYQLRFRGKLTKVPANATNIKYEEKEAYGPVLARIKKENSLAQASTFNDLVTSATSAPLAHDIIANAEAKKKPPKKKTLDEALEEFEALTFEFEKLLYAQNDLLKFNITAQRAAQILNAFKYDQTRLQFLEALLAEYANLKVDKAVLIETFAYELSKQKASELFKE